MASSYITRTSVATGDQQKGTFSGWIKRGNDSYAVVAEEHIFGWGNGASDSVSIIVNSNGQLEIRGKNGGSYTMRNKSNRVLEDNNAFYHLCMQIDTTQGTDSNRLKFWVNNVEIADSGWAETDWPAEDENLHMNESGKANTLGRTAPTNGDFFRGIMSHCYWLDGVIAAPTVFGGYNSTDGMWQVETDPTISSYGTNGWCLKMEDSTDLDDDSGTNNFTFTTSGELTATPDNPDNNFCRLNCLFPYGSGISTFNDAGTQFVGSQGNAWRIVMGSQAVNTGKYYYEVKINTSSANNSYSIGWSSQNNMKGDIWTTYLGGSVTGPAFGLAKDGQINYSTTIAYAQGDTGWTSYTNGGDVICCAIDLTNNFAYYGLNGVWMKSGDPTSGATGTGGFAFDNSPSTTNGIGKYDWFPAFGSSETASGSTCHMSANFGQGYFGNVTGAPTVVTAGTNASGNGTFEYDVPTGYTAISTKGQNI